MAFCDRFKLCLFFVATALASRNNTGVTFRQRWQGHSGWRRHCHQQCLPTAFSPFLRDEKTYCDETSQKH